MSKSSNKTLTAADMITRKRVGRRSALVQLGTVLGGATALVVTGLPATASAATGGTGYTDRDGGALADPAGRGTVGITDSDGGRTADRAGRGVASFKYPAGVITDSDGGRWADPAGSGSGPTVLVGITDSDAGRNCADPAGGGRGGASARVEGVTDVDVGTLGDPTALGRGRGVGMSDSDGGRCADPAKLGRGIAVTGITDSDGGQCADPGGRGRRFTLKKAKSL